MRKRDKSRATRAHRSLYRSSIFHSFWPTRGELLTRAHSHSLSHGQAAPLRSAELARLTNSRRAAARNEQRRAHTTRPPAVLPPGPPSPSRVCCAQPHLRNTRAGAVIALRRDQGGEPQFTNPRAARSGKRVLAGRTCRSALPSRQDRKERVSRPVKRGVAELFPLAPIDQAQPPSRDAHRHVMDC